MSDDFAICPVCGKYDAGFKDIGGDIVKCPECGTEMNRKEIIWRHIEYD
jgi:endogenous inhibitor of DNA gyrase (YacG/DUF329 family)